AGEEILSGAHQDRSNGEVKLVEQSRLQVLADCRRAAADAHILAARRSLRLLERGFDSVGDEEEFGAALHLERLARMVGQDEDGAVVRRLLAPPAFPAFVGPRTAHRAEHVAAEDPRAEVVEALLGHAVVGAGLAAVLAKYRLLEHAGREE